MTSMKQLSEDYFRFLPVSVRSDKPDSEALIHPIFTFGDLRKVLEAEEMLREPQERSPK